MVDNIRECVVHRRLRYVRDRCCSRRCDRYLVAVLECRYCCSCILSYAYGVLLFAKRYGVLVLGLCRSVILPALCRGYDLQFGLVLRDRQRSYALRDRVVASDCCRSFRSAFLTLEYDSVAVIYASDFGDRSRRFEVCRLAVLVTAYASCCRQRLAVVFTAVARRRHRQRRRIDR